VNSKIDEMDGRINQVDKQVMGEQNRLVRNWIGSNSTTWTVNSLVELTETIVETQIRTCDETRLPATPYTIWIPTTW
jgi:hypothetical protein